MGVSKKDKLEENCSDCSNDVKEIDHHTINCQKCSRSCSHSNHTHEEPLILNTAISTPELHATMESTTLHPETDLLSSSHQLQHTLLNQNGNSSAVSDSVFLTPSSPRTRGERPYSAPANYLQQFSGQLLRLVGDHYLCSNCGRQLRNIGDQLTLETSLRHAISSSELLRIKD